MDEHTEGNKLVTELTFFNQKLIRRLSIDNYLNYHINNYFPCVWRIYCEFKYTTK